HDLRLAARIAGDITTSRLMHMATEAALHVADQLKAWRKQREAEGAESLASVLLTSAGEPVELINGESAKVYRFRRAVYSFTRASVL
ncbi:head completion/stabilization protein, partial [Klebsiella pneumoniae]|nr:head completion/stabilization protein [Klebsiella pneumoniae]